MSTFRLSARCLALVLGLAVAGATLAQRGPVPVVRNGIAYVTGGIGADEVQEFLDVAPRYNLRLLFASKQGNYLSDIDVTIASTNCAVTVSVHAEGPFLYAHVPPGRYRITASAPGLTENRIVIVPAHGGVDVRFMGDNGKSQASRAVYAACAGKT